MTAIMLLVPHMLPSPKPARLLDADHLINRLTSLARQHEERGYVSRALGVRSAIELVKRELAAQHKAQKKFPVSSARHD